tara:strand:+ start:894 stop:1109 length:216 start_codon:yes stop_codon:yes gene_type:complete
MKMQITKRHLKKIIKEEISKITEEEKDAYEGRPLEAPLGESDFNLEQIDQVAVQLHHLITWAIDQGYNPRD